MSPPIQLFLTTIASQPALRQRQEYLLRVLQVKKIPFTSYDLASDESAKRLWRRKAPPDKQQLPGILVGGRFPGVFAEFEDAVEYDELDTFLRLKEPWDPDVDEDVPAPPVRPVGVPGAMMPLQMTPERLKSKILAKPASSPLARPQIPVNKREGEFDISTEISGYGLQGVRVTEDELRDLVAELGLDGDDAGDLVKGLSGGRSEKVEENETSTSDVSTGTECTEKEPEVKADKSSEAKVAKALEVDKQDKEA
ncbi:uncharacterized protein BT62DRAFT_1072711 [Guyanagaster necrorhizus]|uniref:SH3 domain-binding glutamic acid-rich protein n=1 Tax=Guyanagaster necrorhizus TaxID=856835 RepID=A0A9P7W3L4_9AGAR|nr:uncharacterized protein BT62DRAFT_1072711 [Guyanagaster necrorhizus MCA 3950]KAG7450671.1 hypothetical protein BT62DRAFT_1072711 [Guyanagaster necrorhizus MCA 3950]